ncbi:hypothetical protein [Lysobacter capsici]|uniref:hypothetical protein n=1 Tax=Lysobacter capsici TaxID=435897 RepID=UPI001BFFDF15|nr:hypothetical protein [Lysobacter capsici]QWF19270.1 hypothetical protein KME82_11285 [Lysobacter capsici]
MSTSVFINGEYRAVGTRLVDDTEPTIWIETPGSRVSLTLTLPQLDQHIAVAQAARALLVAQAVLS